MLNIGEKLREFRTRRGLTQENVAELLEMSVGNYAHIEQGKTKITIQKLQDLAEKLKTDIFELLTLGEKNTFYIQENKDNSTNSYIAHSSLPSDYQKIVVANKDLTHENEKLQLKNEFLEKENSNLQEIIRLMKEQKS
jgi:transcriptional regulator with XRE-family HTH domain